MEETFKIMENKRQKKERGEYDNNAKPQTKGLLQEVCK